MVPELISQAAEVSLKGVGRSFDGKPAVLPMSLRVQPGEFISLLGPSGSGKSTLLRLIAGLDTPDTGSISLNAFGRKFYRAFVFQDAALLPWRNVLRNTMLPLELMGVAKPEASDRAREALNRVGLSDALERFPNQLSGGMKMRASVARAMVAEPTLLLLDEPFAALDENTRYRLQEDLRKLWLTAGMTTIFVTHSVSEAAFVSDRAILFSSRPARVLKDMAIDLPRERTRALRTDARFIQEIQKITSAFESGEGV
jgi:NitT/TauT family transport system ATP-binding protein